MGLSTTLETNGNKVIKLDRQILHPHRAGLAIGAFAHSAAYVSLQP